MAVNETLEAHAALAGGLALQLARPILNRVFPRRFSADDARRIADISARADAPLLRAARLQVNARHDSERHLSRLRRAFGLPPISLRQVCSDRVERADLDHMGRTLDRALFHPIAD